MHVEISVALNFLISHLHSKLPRRRAQLFGEELERLLRARYEGHWYPERPLRGSAFRCLHIGGVLDPLLEQAARSSGLDAAEVRENVPQELRVWIDPFEVSYQIGEKGAVRVLYSEEEEEEGGGGEEEAAAQERASQTREPVPASGEEGSRNSGFNPEARAFVPTGAGLSGSPGAADVFGGPGNPNASPPPSSSSSSPPSSSASFPKSAHPQLLTFTTASFAATKFGSTKMKKGGAGGGGVTVNGAAAPPPQRHGNVNNPSSAVATENPLSLSLCSLVGLGGGGGASQLSPNAKEFVYPESSTSSSSSSADGALFSFGGEVQFQQPQTSFYPFNSAEVSRGFFLEKTPFVDGMGYSLSPHAAPPYPSQPFQQPVVLAN